MVTADDRLDKIEKIIVDNLVPEKEWEPPKRCIFCRRYDFQKKVYTNMVLCSSPNAYEEGDREATYDENSKIIAGELVRQHCRIKGTTTCDHDNEWLVNDAFDLIETISDVIKYKAKNEYHPVRLFEVLYEYIEKQNGPRILLEILNTVGKEWIFSLNPHDFDMGYLPLLEKHGEGFGEGWIVPANHPNIYRRPSEWAKICKCDDCQRPEKIRKEELGRAIEALINSENDIKLSKN